MGGAHARRGHRGPVMPLTPFVDNVRMAIPKFKLTAFHMQRVTRVAATTSSGEAVSAAAARQVPCAILMQRAQVARLRGPDDVPGSGALLRSTTEQQNNGLID